MDQRGLDSHWIILTMGFGGIIHHSRAYMKVLTGRGHGNVAGANRDGCL